MNKLNTLRVSLIQYIDLIKTGFAFWFVFSSFSGIQAQCAFSLGSDQYFCSGQNINLTIPGPAGYSIYQWNTGSNAQGITVTSPGSYICTAQLLSNDLVVNGNLDAGNTGFTSTYTYSMSGQISPGIYAVVTNPGIQNGAWAASMGDHTSGTGNMLIYDGIGVSIVWTQTITVLPNTLYNFSAWAASIGIGGSDINHAELQFSINGVLLSNPDTCGNPGVWSQFNATWFSGSNTTALIQIVDQQNESAGNDFALDDIQFQEICSYSDTIVIDTLPLPDISISGPHSLNCSSTPITLHGNSSITNAQYSWGGPAAYTQISQDALINLPGTYTLTVTNNLTGCSNSLTVYIDSVATLNYSVCGPQIINCYQTQAVLNVSSTSSALYAWSGPNMFSSALQNPVVSQSGIYTVTISDTISGCTKTDSVLVTTDTITPQVYAGSDQTLSCSVLSIVLTANPINSNVTCVWTTPFLQTINGTSINATDPGEYILSGINLQNGCSSTDTVVINPLVPGPSETVTVVPVSCFGGNTGSITLNLTGGTPPFTYTWANAPGINSPVASNLQAGIYTCVIQDYNGCSVTVATPVTEPDQVLLAAIAPVSICPGQQIPLTANATGGTAPYSYSWTDSNGLPMSSPYTPNASQTYQVMATDALGCPSFPATGTITVLDSLTLIAGTPTAICPGDTAFLSVQVISGTGNYTYNWQPGSYTTMDIQVIPNQTSLYTVTVSDFCGTATQTVTINVLPPPLTPIITGDTAGCEPFCVTYNTPVISGLQYNWHVNNLVSTIGDSLYNCFSSGTYTVYLSVMDNMGCSNQSSLTVTVYSTPKADFSYASTELSILNPLVNFNNTSQNADHYLWNFGDNIAAVSPAIHPTHYYPEKEDCYTVTLEAYNAYCADTTTRLLCVNDIFVIYFPNAFSPDNDGINDTWFPKGIGIDESNFQYYIYDRWGNLVFETTSWGVSWNGIKIGGNEIVQEDVYIWKARLKDRFGLKHEYKGTVTVIK